jgi:hypothetical protein
MSLRILKRLALAGAGVTVAVVGVAISTPVRCAGIHAVAGIGLTAACASVWRQMPSEAELRELLRAAEGRPVPPPRVFAGDASACPVLNPSGGGAGGSVAMLQSLARAGGEAGGATLLGYDKGRPVYASAAEEAERELAELRWQEDAAKRRGAQPPPEAELRKAELKQRLKDLKKRKA